MALQKSWTWESFTYAEAYFKVTGVHVTKEDGIRYEMAVFPNQAARDAGAKPLGYLNGETDYDENSATNAIREIYLYLKTTDDFSDAEDV